MRKTFALLAATTLAGLGALLPATSAQAESWQCDNKWHNASSGYFYAYDFKNCGTQLGRAAGNDNDWGDLSGNFTNYDANQAESVLHKGTSGLSVAVYDAENYGRGVACIRKAEFYASDLSDNRFSTYGPGTGRALVANNIESHQWVTDTYCASTFLS
ncbi:hypothetical protein G6045_00955 [Streptomyces sp. YC504]|uniref:Peptidase inhibitor family I36 protein n=1 Tax=Streptomyces mesophilus TaxID=1775132 RepID=A0A6G4XC90_9ACTN|nr:hypothetical protein [Streptomyces mesophilus]NGO74261.1 hypothetical protein [Streptomyces mesophilus]